MFSTFEMCEKYLNGCSSSSLNETLLAKQKFDGEIHTYSPSFKPTEFDEIVKHSNFIVFNSFSQLKLYKDKLLPHNSIGMRINPNISTTRTALYDPCSINSRLGVKIDDFKSLLNLDGIHFHALCEQNSDSLEIVLDKVINDFGIFFPKLKWINFGGGHLITEQNYDIDKLLNIISNFQNMYPNLQIYFELGGSIGWKTGYLESTILDIVHNGIDIAILDTSCDAHTPDVLHMPYTPKIRYAKSIKSMSLKEKLNGYIYQIAGNTCLSGDIFGTYCFNKKLNIGDKIIFEDMMHYTMVKTTTFNGINLPSIAIKRKNGNIDIIKNFGYEDYKNRLS